MMGRVNYVSAWYICDCAQNASDPDDPDIDVAAGWLVNEVQCQPAATSISVR